MAFGPTRHRAWVENCGQQFMKNLRFWRTWGALKHDKMMVLKVWGAQKSSKIRVWGVSGTLGGRSGNLLSPKGRKSEKKLVRGPCRGSQIGGQNPLNIDKKGIKNQRRILLGFYRLFLWFWFHLEFILVTFGVEKVARSEKAVFSKMLIFHCFYKQNRRSEGPKSIKNR